MASEADGKDERKTDGAGPRGLRRLRRVHEAGDPRLLRSQLEEPARELRRADHRVRAGDVDGRRFGQGRQRPQEGGARARPAWSRCASACATRCPGPLGIILTGAAAVSLAGYVIKNQKEIREKVGAYRTLIVETRTRFEEAQGGYRAGRYDAASRNLMVDGLLKRFLDDIDAK